MENGFVVIPRSLLHHPTVKTASPIQKWILITIIENACFSECIQDDHGVLISLKPGQFLCTERYIAELANTSKTNVRRAIRRFMDVKILRQEVNHLKSIISVCHKDTYDLNFNRKEPTSGPRMNQEWTKNEPQKNKVTKKQGNKTQRESAHEINFSISEIYKKCREKNIVISPVEIEILLNIFPDGNILGAELEVYSKLSMKTQQNSSAFAIIKTKLETLRQIRDEKIVKMEA